MKTIVQDGDPVLRKEAKAVPEKLFGSAELFRLVADMAEALDAEPDGVALAAPQVDVSWRLFIVRIDRTLPPPHVKEGEKPPERPAQVDVYINPEIIRRSRKKQESDEGCLSVRGMYGTTKRAERATVRARRPDGSKFERGASGLLAQIFQHEVDHLNGILFTDHATNLLELSHKNEPA
jgi:peptide deformylase